MESRASERMWKAGLLVGLVAVAKIGISEELPPLSWQTFDEILERAVPQAEELRYEKIEWRATLSEAVSEAEAKGKPVLVWAMNGDPCGFT